MLTKHGLLQRPETFECPWCGPNGVSVDFSLPLYLRLCDACLPYPTVDAEPVPAPIPQAVTDLRAILRDHVRDMHVDWPGQNFGKAIIGNAILGALESYGCDRRAELTRAQATD